MAKFHLKLVPRFFNAKRTIKKGAAAKTVRKFAPENDFCKVERYFHTLFTLAKEKRFKSIL